LRLQRCGLMAAGGVAGRSNLKCTKREDAAHN
jgi:hypothetical protein